jgi:transcriptional regulator with XRE-family HTH domain
VDTDDAAAAAAAPRSLLRAARQGRGWSQSEAAGRLAALASRRGAGAARPDSLKTQLSRWENGHATPAPEHRALLAELYASTATDLGLEPATPVGDAGGADRLRAALARSEAVDEHGLDLLHDQLRATAALDHRLGTAAAHAATSAQVEQLGDLLAHCTDPATTGRLAALLAGAALLAADQERDRDAPDLAWRAYTVAADAARRAGRDDLVGLADRGRDVLRQELSTATGHRDRTAGIDVHAPPVPIAVGPAHDGDGASVRDRTEEALREALDAERAGNGGDAAAAASRARLLALRAGSARTLARLAALGR